MDNQEKHLQPVQGDEQEIDLIELAKKLWDKRLFLLKCCGVAAVVGLVVAFSIPKEYSTTVKLTPETTDPSKKMGNLGGLAAMAGINLNTSSGADAISPELYPDVVHSVPFLLELFPIDVTTVKGNKTYTVYDYISEHQRQPWWGYITKAPFRLIGGIKSLFTGGKEEENETAELTPFRLTEKQSGVIQALQQRIGVTVDKKTSVITVSVQMQDPLISATLTRIVMEKLQNYITAYRTQKVKQDLEFTQKVFKEAKDAYYKAQKAYASFEDANKNIISASYRTEQERLKNEMSLTFDVYTTLAQKLEQDKLRVQEQTPVYTVIEPASVPLRPASPKKPLILAGFIFLGLVGGIGYIFIKDMFASLGGQFKK